MPYLAQALRRLRRSPTFAALSILTLGVGIAAAVAVFAVVDGVLLRPLPYPDSERLVSLSHDAPGLDLDGMGQSDATYLRYREHARAFEEVALYDTTTVSLRGPDEPLRLETLLVTPSLFPVLAIAPAVGRPFREAEGAPGAAPVVLLGDALWRRSFGADPGVVGRDVVVDGVSREVVGVLPPGLAFPNPDVALWLPLELDPAKSRLGAFSYEAVGRLRPGVTPVEARQDLERLLDHMVEAFPGQSAAAVLQRAGFTPRVTTLRQAMVGGVAASLWLVLGAVGFVLLIACANVANLFLVRAEARERETAVRVALGAGRRHLLGAALVESLLLVAAACAVAVAGAAGALALLTRFGPVNLPRLQAVGLDGRVLAVAVGLSLATGVFFGLLPIGRGLGRLAVTLREGGRSGGAGRAGRRVRHLLVGAQVALALVLLVGSGLMVRSFVHLIEVDPGFRGDDVLAVDLSLPEADYADDEAAASFFERLVERLTALPGVTSAGALSDLPLSNSFSGAGHALEDLPLEEDAPPPVFGVVRLAPGTLGTIGIPLMAGRDLEPADAAERRGVALVSAALARHYWPQESALGKRLMPGRPSAEEDTDPWYTVVGVVGDVRVTGLEDEPTEMVYYPVLGKEKDAWNVRRMTVVLRTGGEPTALAGAVRQAVWELDPNLPISNVRTLDAMIRRARAPMAFTVALLLVAAAVSLILGSVGTFGVISYLVSRRTAEIGVRMALGARPRTVRRMVLREGVFVALGGIAVGLAAAVGLTRWLDALLFEVSPLDPLTFVAVPALLVGVVAAASWLPAERAARLAPVEALRHE